MKSISADWVSDFDDKPHPVQKPPPSDSSVHCKKKKKKKKKKISNAILITHLYDHD